MCALDAPSIHTRTDEHRSHRRAKRFAQAKRNAVTSSEEYGGLNTKRRTRVHAARAVAMKLESTRVHSLGELFHVLH